MAAAPTWRWSRTSCAAAWRSAATVRGARGRVLRGESRRGLGPEGRRPASHVRAAAAGAMRVHDAATPEAAGPTCQCCS